MPFRCTSTEKFASYDEAEAEVESEEVNGSTYTATVRCVRPCAECGEEASEYTFEVYEDFECERCGTECPGHDPGGNVLDKDENGDPIDPVEVEFTLELTNDPEISESGGGRYKKNIFTCTVSAEILCGCCGDTIMVGASDEAAASSFEVLL